MSKLDMISGTPAMGVLLHHWHVGMDAVYGVGSMWFAGRPAQRDQVEIAVQLLRSCMYMELSSEDRDELIKLINYLKEKLSE